MARVRAEVVRAAGLDLPVLVAGETGVGKELVARAIHECSAFTGADQAHQGFFETAGGGTILLDETGEVRSTGSATSRKVACRMVATTNAQLDQLVGEDRTDGLRPTMSEELQRALRAYAWPGNVRELRNEMERMRLVNSDQPAYDLAHLDPRISGASAQAAARSGGPEAAATRPAPRFIRGRTPIRRIDDIRELFRAHRRLTRLEVADTLDLSLSTATKYLQQLVSEGFIRRVEPNASPRSHYFELA